MTRWLLLAAACRTPASAAPGGPMTPFTVAILAQSNGSGATGPSPFDLADQLHRGAQVVDNGEALGAYPTLVGPEPWIVEDLLDAGFAPRVVIRALPGLNLENLRTKQLPLLIGDLGPTPPDVVLVWQGESDARVEGTAREYRQRLAGPFGVDGDESLRDLLRAQWPDAPMLVVELRVRDYDYAAFHREVRAAQHDAGTLPGVCLVPSYDAPLIQGDNQPHVSVEGLEIVARHAVDAALALTGGERCP
ncbi:MAG: hypothetical protein R3F59_13400 [Myxococcota bacterium]